jgi:hypothetical protein
MGRPGFPRTIMEFQDRFATEAEFLSCLAASRWPERFGCPGCGGGRAWASAGTLAVLGLRSADRGHGRDGEDGTRSPLRTWFWAA